MSESKSLKRNFIYNTIYQFLIIVLPLITAPYLAHTLGVEANGKYAYTFTIVSYFMMISMLGFQHHGNRSIAYARGNGSSVSTVFVNIYSMQVISWLLSTSFYLIFIFFFAMPSLHSLLYIQLINLASVLLDVNWFFFGMEEFKITVTRNIAVKVLTLIAILVFVKSPEDLWKYTLIIGVGTLLGQLVMWPFLIKRVRFEKPKIKLIIHNIKPVLLLFIPVASYSVYKLMNKLVLGNLVDMYSVGIYEYAEKIISAPNGLIIALGTVMLPRMSKVYSSESQDNKQSEKILLSSFVFMAVLIFPIVFGLLSTGTKLVPVIFGMDFIDAGKVLQIMSISLVFISVSSILRTQVLIPKSQDIIYVISTIIGAVVNLICSYIFVYKFGAIGAALAYICSEIFVCLFQVFQLRNTIRWIEIYKTCIPIVICSIGMFIVVYLSGMIKMSMTASLLIQIFVGIISYVVFLSYVIFKTKSPLYDLLPSSIKKKIKKKTK